MFSMKKNYRFWMIAFLLSYLLISPSEAKALDCERHCRVHRMSIGSCRCRPELFVKKSLPSSEYNDGNRDYIIKELLKDYFMQNEESEEK
ncbi:unnamed protein product [Larinioides sclopetarius]|uniref:Uncharacterized protein n=1 Tax=Larinioides sclopetarius TaxID=280406 RepID=A0AAV1ZCF9_9ARAC